MPKRRKSSRNANTKGGLLHEADAIERTSQVYAAHRDAAKPTPRPTPQPKNAIENLQKKQQMLKDVMSW